MGAEAAEQVRAADVVGTLCLATDLGMGLPFEHGLRTTMLAVRLADELQVGREVSAQAYYAAMLSHVACTTDADIAAEIFGGSLLENADPFHYAPMPEVVRAILRAIPDPASTGLRWAAQVAVGLPRVIRLARPQMAALCEVAEMLAARIGLPAATASVLAHLTDRWDGNGFLRRGKGDDIPLAIRLVAVAEDTTLQQLVLGDRAKIAATIRSHAGHGLDPAIAHHLADNLADLAEPAGRSVWGEVQALEPAPHRYLRGPEIDEALTSIGSFSDLLSPHFSGHSTGVAELAEAAARQIGLNERAVTQVRRAGFVHDLGRAAISVKTWQKPGPLNAGEWEKVRLHPYYTQRVLSRSPFMEQLAPVATTHHERLDGSGYHRGLRGADLTMPARVLAAADAYHTRLEPRPHRPTNTPEEATTAVVEEVDEGRLDPDAVTAVLAAAGREAPRMARPAGLTDRESEVVGLLARGLATKQVAARLQITVKTADHHIQNAYRKMGVSTRAGATLFAMQHGLLAWGELPMVSPLDRT